MDLLDLLKLMFRRWYITAPFVLATVGAALVLGVSIQPEYKTSAAVLLVPPTVAVSEPDPNAPPKPANPWLRVGESAMAQAVEISVSADDARSKIVAAGGDGDYEVTVVTRSSILTMEITAPSRASALATVTGLTTLVKDEVASQQAEYRPKAGEQITTQVLDAGLSITQSRSNVIRAQIVAVVIGLLVAAAAAVLFDAIARRRAARRRGNPRRDHAAAGWPGDAVTANIPATGAAPGGADGDETVDHAPGDATPRPPIPAPALPPRTTEGTGAHGGEATAQPGTGAAHRVSAPNGRAFAPKTPNLGGGTRADESVMLSTTRTPVEGPTE